MRRRRQPAMSIMKRTMTWLAVVVAAATTITVVTASPASALTASAAAYGPAGWAYFDADDNILSIHDSHADGVGVVVPNYRSDLGNTKPYYGWNRDGYNTTTYYYLNMPYGASIKFQVCSESMGELIDNTCGAPAWGFAS